MEKLREKVDQKDNFKKELAMNRLNWEDIRSKKEKLGG